LLANIRFSRNDRKKGVAAFIFVPAAFHWRGPWNNFPVGDFSAMLASEEEGPDG
jgi:hypothetical protein